jgi:hypothetical protein
VSNIVLSIDSPSSNANPSIINFIEKKNIEKKNIETFFEEKAEHEECKKVEPEVISKPQPTNILLNTFLNKF